jgi:succinyl-CoA synthetase beta subunit
MNIHEYQAKEILGRKGVSVPRGILPASAREARTAAEELGGSVVVKAQIHAGGRGKAGGIKLASSPDEAAALYEDFLGMRLVTKQTGPGGARVRRVYLEEALAIKRELYLSFLVDRKSARIAIIASAAGGSGVEDGAGKKLLKALVDPCLGPTVHALRELAGGLGIEARGRQDFFAIVQKLYRVFCDLDCSLLEINPLALLEEGRLLPLDCKMSFDDNALFRHPELLEYRDIEEGAPEEFEASKYGLSYVKLDGSIACMVNGAGLAMATLDALSLRGGSSANYLDLGGGASREAVKKAFSIILEDGRVKAVLVNVLGGIVRCDEVAQGIAAAARQAGSPLAAAGGCLPIVARLAGNHADEGRVLLANGALGPAFPVRFASTMEEAATLAVAAARSGGRE